MGCCASITPADADGTADRHVPVCVADEAAGFTDLAAASGNDRAQRPRTQPKKKKETRIPPPRWVPPQVDPALQPVVITSGVGNCYTCSRAFNTAAGGFRAFELPCGHQHHEACVEAQLRERRACPTCGAAAHPATVPTQRLELAEMVALQASRRAASLAAVVAAADRSPSAAGAHHLRGGPAAPGEPSDAAAAAATARLGDDAGAAAPPTDAADDEAAHHEPARADDVASSEPAVLPLRPASAMLGEDEAPVVPAESETQPVPPALVFDLAVEEGATIEPRLCDLCDSALEQALVVLPCGDVYHAACADQWLAGHGCCPGCRQQQPPLIPTTPEW